MDKNASAHGRCMSSTSVEKEAIEKSHVIVVQKIYKNAACARQTNLARITLTLFQQSKPSRASGQVYCMHNWTSCSPIAEDWATTFLHQDTPSHSLRICNRNQSTTNTKTNYVLSRI
jgi:hypothetical protein